MSSATEHKGVWTVMESQSDNSSQEIKFLGNIISGQWVSADLDKV